MRVTITSEIATASCLLFSSIPLLWAKKLTQRSNHWHSTSLCAAGVFRQSEPDEICEFEHRTQSWEWRNPACVWTALKTWKEAKTWKRICTRKDSLSQHECDLALHPHMQTKITTRIVRLYNAQGQIIMSLERICWTSQQKRATHTGWNQVENCVPRHFPGGSAHWCNWWDLHKTDLHVFIRKLQIKTCGDPHQCDCHLNHLGMRNEGHLAEIFAFDVLSLCLHSHPHVIVHCKTQRSQTLPFSSTSSSTIQADATVATMIRTYAVINYHQPGPLLYHLWCLLEPVILGKDLNAIMDATWQLCLNCSTQSERSRNLFWVPLLLSSFLSLRLIELYWSSSEVRLFFSFFLVCICTLTTGNEVWWNKKNRFFASRSIKGTEHSVFLFPGTWSSFTQWKREAGSAWRTWRSSLSLFGSSLFSSPLRSFTPW